jgi:fructose-1,6-bisphosphatase/sedoheptulose 1,7-bisphosphatase-like protein
VLNVAFDATGLTRGDHFSDLVVFSNDPDEPELVIPSRLRTRHSISPRRR